MHPIIILNDYDGIVRRNIGLIEYEGLLLWRCPFMLAFF
jgi:hypothetical protein